VDSRKFYLLSAPFLFLNTSYTITHACAVLCPGICAMILLTLSVLIVHNLTKTLFQLNWTKIWFDLMCQICIFGLPQKPEFIFFDDFDIFFCLFKIFLIIYFSFLGSKVKKNLFSCNILNDNCTNLLFFV